MIARNGPGFTLSQVAEQAGVSVGTVGQRFRSKQGLLLALSRQTTSQVTESMHAVARDSPDPVAGLRAALVSVYAWLGSAETAANHLGQLGVDLGDPELRRLLGEHYAAVQRVLHALVCAASDQLPSAPEPAVAARVLLSVANGASLDWSIRPSGQLSDRLDNDVAAVLTGWEKRT